MKSCRSPTTKSLNKLKGGIKWNTTVLLPIA